MLKLRHFWLLIAVISFGIGIYDFFALKQAKDSGRLLPEARLRADAYTEIGFGLGSVIIYELAAINAKLKKERYEQLKDSQLSEQMKVNHYSPESFAEHHSNKVKF